MRSKFNIGWLLILPLLAAFLCLPLRSNAQSFYGSLVGTITDSSAAVVPSAKVTLTSLGTNEARTATTDAAGNYRFMNLVPGEYKIEAEAASYKHFLRSGLQVQVDTTFRVDAQLEVGAATETVEITATAPLLQTESGSMGDTVEGKQVQEMPLNGRNTLNLIALVPGVIPQGGTSGSASGNSGQGTSSASWGNYQIGGGMPLQSSMYLDGAPLSILNKNFTALVPSQDMIQEFKVESSGVSAEFGRFGGGVVNMTTKSGTNKFHGQVYEYIRNSVVNANYFFAKRNGTKRAPWTQNQFGFTVNGPIWKDKLFFFYTWEAIHIRSGSPLTTNVPTQNMQNGIFTGMTATTANPTPNYVADPASCGVIYNDGALTRAQAIAAPATVTKSVLVPGCLDAAGQVFKTMYAAPNSTGNASYNYYYTLPKVNDGTQQTVRIDYNLSANQRIFGRYTYWPLVDGAANAMQNPNGWNTSNSATHNRTTQIVVGDTITLNPTTIVDVRAAYLRQYGDAIPPAMGTADLSKFGAAYTAMKPNLSQVNYPMVSFATGSQLYTLYNFAYNNITQTFYNNYQLSASMTKILGKHTLKTGVEGRLIQRDDLGNNQNAGGTFAFSKSINNNEWAAMLMGNFDTGTVTTIKPTTTNNKYYGFYATDTWQATRKLTLNLGLRYDLPGAPAENKDNASVLLPNTVDPVTGVRGTVGLVKSSFYDKRTTLVPIYNAFGPRVGFAYRLTDSMVVRGGYALSYLPNDAQVGNWANNSPVNLVSTANRNTATSITNKLSNPFPAGFAQAQGRADTTFMHRYIGQTVSAPDPYQPYPRSQAMNISIGKQFKGDVLVDIGATHTLGTHLASISAGLNQLESKYFACGTDANAAGCGGHKLNDSTISTTAPVSAPADKIIYDNQVLPNALQIWGQKLRPYPAYNNYSNSSDYHGTSSYNSLQAKVVKRFKKAGQIGGAFTWMKMIGDTDTILTSQETKSGGAGGNGEGLYQDFYNRKAERSIYSYNAPIRIVVNYILNLPFGKGQRYGSGVSGIGDKLISGWAVNGITTIQSGNPLYMTISQNNLSKNFGAGTIRPNYQPGCAKSNSSAKADTVASATGKWFNVSCFTAPISPTDHTLTGTAAQALAANAFGNEERVDGTLKADGIKNFDFAAQKTTSIHDKVSVAFRIEFFNLFNRTQFAPPVTQTDNADAGKILNQGNNPRLIQGALRVSF